MHFSLLKKERGPGMVLLLFSIMFGLKVNASDGSVLYLKNGNILPCVYYRQLPNGDYRVRIRRDTLIRGANYQIQTSRDTQLIISVDQVFAAGAIHRHAVKGYELDYKYDSLSKTYTNIPNYYVHEHGFFFQWQLCLGLIDGMRFIAGYRFNTYVALGIGTGGEYGVTLSKSNSANAPPYVYNSGYSPFYLYLTGDILKTKITPFYSFELGYNLPWYPNQQTNREDGAVPPPYDYYTNYGGPASGLGLGCRFYSRRRGNVSISLNMNVGYMNIKTNAFVGYPNPNYPFNPIYEATTSNYLMLQPSVRFSAGF